MAKLGRTNEKKVVGKRFPTKARGIKLAEGGGGRGELELALTDAGYDALRVSVRARARRFPQPE